MSTVSSSTQTIQPIDALWSLFMSMPKAVRKSFTQRILTEDVKAERMREQLAVKLSLTQAFEELKEARQSGMELPDARNLFK